MHDSRTVANYILELADRDHNTLTPMQLLKLVYIAHGWSMGLRSTPLVSDRIEAWQYGPVIPNLYRAVRKFRSDPVSGPLMTGADDRLSDEDQDLITQVYEIYGHLSGPALSRLTHQPRSPWARTYEDGLFGVQISNDLIEDHYARLAKPVEAASR